MTTDANSTWTIVVAAGEGSRFGSETPKQFIEIGGRRVIDWSLRAAATVSTGIVVVLPVGDHRDVGLREPNGVHVVATTGGASRSESVRRGLMLVPEDAAIVLVHDAARPVASPGLFARVAAAVRDGAQAVIPVVEVVDTMRHVNGDPVDRAKLQAVQTPQGFAAAALRKVHRGQPDATDDASLVAAAGGQVVTVAGERWNIKLTDPTDELVIAALLGAQAT